MLTSITNDNLQESIQYEESGRVKISGVKCLWLSDLDLREFQFDYWKTRSSRFENCDLIGTNFANIFLHDTTFRDCKLTESTWDQVSKQGYAGLVAFHSCDLSRAKMKFIKNPVDDTDFLTFKNCNLNRTVFRDSYMSNVQFENCYFHHTDFYGATIYLQEFDLQLVYTLYRNGAQIVGLTHDRWFQRRNFIPLRSYLVLWVTKLVNWLL